MSASTSTPPAPAGPPLQDETDQRVSLGAFAKQRVSALREGELGSLPIVLGIIVIAIYFQSRNSNFLTAGNFVNLIAQMAAIMIIGTGIVFVLLLGEIDLSVGYVSGMGGVIVALLLEPGKGVSTWEAIALGLATGVAIGVLQGFFVARLGVPSFVVTLAGLLGWNGVLLQIIGSSGTIVIQNSFVNSIANNYMSAALSWIVAIVLVAAYASQGLSNVFRRRQAGLPTDPWAFVIGRIVILAIAAIAVVAVANSDRGLPYVTLIMLGSYVISGRSWPSAHASGVTSTQSAGTPKRPVVRVSTCPASRSPCSRSQGSWRRSAESCSPRGLARSTRRPAVARSCSTRSPQR